MTPANDNQPAHVWRDGRPIYRIRAGERVCLLTPDKLMIVHPGCRPKLISALDGRFLGELRA